MDVYTVDIRSWTASFRYPNLLSGMQPTLEVPPVSTVLGLINAAAGRYIKHTNFSVGYYFEYGAKAQDIETIYMIQSGKDGPLNQGKANVIKREFLYDTFLRLYLPDSETADFFKTIAFPLFLGRSCDLANADIKNIALRSLQPIKHSDKIRGQIIPFRDNCLPGVLQALPKYFTNTFPREPLGVEPYSIINCRANINSGITAYRDETMPGKEVDIYFHKIAFDR